MTRYRLDPTWRRPGDGRVVIAGSPLRLFRLSPGGAHVIAQVEAGTPPATGAVRQLLDRFVDAGALHPLPDPADAPFTAADLTVVMPVHGRAATPPPGLATIVVDDASPSPAPDAPVPPAEVMAATAIRRLRHDVNRGPAAARNTGLAEVTTPLVAFVDADVVLPEGWLAPLLAHFADDRVALVAPRVAGLPGDGPVARYEVRHSPLDLGPEPARIRAGTRVSYVPAAVLLCRTDALREAGGFDEGLRFGEDVDLVWRLTEAGHRARYEPEVVVHHEPRPSWPALWHQRVGYGRSAAPLARRHPGALAPVRMSGWSLAVWALAVARRPFAAVALAAGTAVALQRKLRDVPPAVTARLVVLGHLAAGRQLAEATRRVWWPLAAISTLVCRKARLPVAAAVLAPAVRRAAVERRPAALLDAPAHLADDMAYGVGVWAGVLAEREVGPLRPELTSWPRRGDG